VPAVRPAWPEQPGGVLLVREQTPGSQAVSVPELTRGPVAKQAQARTGPAVARIREGTPEVAGAQPVRAWAPVAERFQIPGIEGQPRAAVLGPNWEPHSHRGRPRS
jgi:hypothetical protein